MIGFAALLVCVLFASGVYLMLSGNVQRIAIGFILLSNGVNLLVLAASGLPQGAVPPLLEKDTLPGDAFADPLAQAFILTAIVIGLGTASFLLALAASTHRETDSDELRPEAEG
ncbi:MAG: NADH-quinone oxidoreductase subunit K [Gemmatimonadetes bacterium]|jgi:multicomponent Na+:H+ antiporter subunit C|nr:NADH-quinone oxidoreductase subunit K [Gemmatimonadota bacterium]MBA3968760.1 NADH-quinone oxidoreductase subunit K [Gemmatimonadota bacterium]MDQ3309339.1 NADH-quinone oxidoreductase subunit K [Gemmatimonadota bacterium]MDQ3523359.1 NADH-quinone oxidoreductase subunit K [Gemmatimonadota bacterium]